MLSLFFFGSDQYSATVLSSLLAANQFELKVVTDHTPKPNPIELLAKKHNLTVFYYPSIPNELITQSTLGLCASFDHLLPSAIITIFDGNLYNLHPSLLPQYRNVSPVPYALALGDSVTGITLFRISTGIDNGEIVAQVAEPIKDNDISPTLLHRLFTIGANLFLNHAQNPTPFKSSILNLQPNQLIFTRSLTSQHGHVEWSVLQKLLAHQFISPDETDNPLLRLRLTHNPQGNILHDLVRGLSGWERVWTIAPTKKGELRLTIESVLPKLTVKLAGKPKAISWSDFTKYYL
ncbi:MAG: hypothetical protein UX62_C0044G0013 [Microgenomates group bacterium GW2011_GWA2_46_7]|nr:MAG: hypothetical protein UX62_C0044G0013 [Microgenomates group bacterium GW2011_GWA2_46_7]